MLTPTYDAVRAILSADPTLSSDERARALVAIKACGRAETGKTFDVAVRRLEAAKRLAISPKTLDLWRRQGRLKPIAYGNKTRAVAFRESDLQALLNGEQRHE